MGLMINDEIINKGLMHQPTYALNKNTIHDKYYTPTCFGSGVPSSGSSLEQRKTIPNFTLIIPIRAMQYLN
jgi:hypothetical protein